MSFEKRINKVLNSIKSWESELELLDKVDLNSATQDGKTLDILMQSVLLKRQISVYVCNVIEENNLSDYYLVENIESDIEDVNKFIELTKEDQDLTNDYSWEKEVNNLNLLNQKLTEIKNGNIDKNQVDELKNIAESGVITSKIFNRILELEPSIKAFL